MQKKSKLFIISSLAMLFVFLSYWLWQAYLSERTVLQREIRLVYLSAARTIDEQFFKQIIPHLPTSDLVHKEMSIDIKKTSDKVDSNHKFTFIRNKNVSIVTSEAQVHDTVKSISVIVKPTKKEDIIKKEKLSLSFLDLEKLKYNLHQQIQDTFKVFFTNANIPIQYRFVKDKNQNGLFIEEEGMMMTGDKERRSNILEIIDYQWFIIKKMLPQILFSLFLFSAMCFSCWVLYRNWREQQRLAALKDDLIANITHELKTPITTVGAAIEALSDFGGLQNPERTQEYLELSKMELNRLSMLVDKVLKMSLFEQQKMTMYIETLDLKTLIKEVTASMRPQFEKLQAKITINSNDFEDYRLQGDKVHLANLMYNLLDNALKYSLLQPIIEISLYQKNNKIECQVSDNGIGVSSDYRDKIFEKFFRIPTGNRHDVKGYGLGLSYVAEVVKQHQGSITITSELGKGSCFCLTLQSKC